MPLIFWYHTIRSRRPTDFGESALTYKCGKDNCKHFTVFQTHERLQIQNNEKKTANDLYSKNSKANFLLKANVF